MAREELEAQQPEYARWQAIATEPMSADRSLAVFLREYGQDHFTVGAGIGAYCLDWGHIALEKIDETAKRDSFGKYSGNGFLMLRTEYGPDSDDSGRLFYPELRSEDGTAYVLKYAKYSEGDGEFHLMVEVQPQWGEKTEASMTLVELRAALGPAPERKRPWNRRQKITITVVVIIWVLIVFLVFAKPSL